MGRGLLSGQGPASDGPQTERMELPSPSATSLGQLVLPNSDTDEVWVRERGLEALGPGVPSALGQGWARPHSPSGTLTELLTTAEARGSPEEDTTRGRGVVETVLTWGGRQSLPPEPPRPTRGLEHETKLC